MCWTRPPAGGCRKRFMKSYSPIRLSRRRRRMSETERLVQRPEFVHKSVETRALGVVKNPLTLWERARNKNTPRRAFIFFFLGPFWQFSPSILDTPLFFPPFTA